MRKCIFSKKNFVDPEKRECAERNHEDLFQLVCDMMDGKLDKKRFKKWNEGAWYDEANLIDKGYSKELI